MEQLRNDVISKVRSCLISTKGSITLRQLEDDYRILIGERIPYMKMGHKTLVDFLQTVPTLVVTKNSSGQIMVNAKATADTAHIAEMVNKQKSVAPKKKYLPRYVPANQKYSQNSNATKWRPKNMTQQSSRSPVSMSNRLQKVSHNQFVQKELRRYTDNSNHGGGSSSSNRRQSNRDDDDDESPPPSPPSPPRTNGVQNGTSASSASPLYRRPSVPSKVVVPEKSRTLQKQTSRESITAGSSTRGLRRFERNASPDSSNEDGTEGTTCSPLVSTKRRISKLMAEIDLDRDSGTSSPTSETHVAPGAKGADGHPAFLLKQAYSMTAPAPKPKKVEFDMNKLYSIAEPKTTASYSVAAPVTMTTTTPPAVIAAPKFDSFEYASMPISLKGGHPIAPAFEYQFPPKVDYPSAPPKVSEYIPTGDAVVDLKNFASIYNLGPVEVKFITNKPKYSKTQVYYCKIKVGEHSYSSYPDDFQDEPSAELHTARKALDDLVPKHTKRRTLLISVNGDVIERIPPMLEKHQAAVWSTQIELDYCDTYGEQLPANWLAIIDSSPLVSIEKCAGGSVLKYCKPGDVFQKGKRFDMTLTPSDVSVASNTIYMSESGRIDAVVTTVNSACEIWCQQCGTLEYASFVEMTTRMEEFYNQHKDRMVANKINFNSCYVALHDNNWFRIRALSVPKEGYVSCFLIDFGDEFLVAESNIFYLNREFAFQQAQAFVCRLHGLEELYTVSAGSEVLQSLQSKQVVLEMVSEEDGGESEPSMSVVMYGTDGRPINEDLITALTMESATPVIHKGIVTEVYVTNIESNGDIYIQIHTPGYQKLQEMLGQLEAAIRENPPNDILGRVTPETSKNGRLFLMRDPTDPANNRWSRASILDWSPSGVHAQVYFVDYGHAPVLKIDEHIMYPLDRLHDVVSKYPPQALKTRIMLDSIQSDFKESASRLMPKDHVVLLKVVNFDNENVAWVELFKRSADGGLFCVNKSIVVEAEIQNINTASNTDKMTRQRLLNLAQYNENTIKNVPSGGSLPKPTLPERGKYFNVNVPFAVNPWNFFVQPLDTFDDLGNLMADMQKTYKDYSCAPLPIDEILPGNIYASKHEDGRWYRTSVLKVIHSGSISVFYCDFGFYTNLTLAQLVPLEPKYMVLPYQAVKAKLSGIKPVKSKWTVDDCDTFRKMVTKKQFVSILVDVEKDELYRSDIILNLLLIDTTTDVDVHIREELVKLGVATKI